MLNGKEKVAVTEAAVVIRMEDVNEEVRALRVALLVMAQKRFCEDSDITNKGLVVFYYAASYLDPTNHHLATIESYHPKHHLGSH